MEVAKSDSECVREELIVTWGEEAHTHNCTTWGEVTGLFFGKKIGEA